MEKGTSDILPTLGETVMGKTFTTTCGGKGANQAVAAASLNMAPVAIVTRVGDDSFGTNLLDNFRRAGVDYFGGKEETVLKAIPSGVASIVVDEKSGENMVRSVPTCKLFVILFVYSQWHHDYSNQNMPLYRCLCLLLLLPDCCFTGCKL